MKTKIIYHMMNQTTDCADGIASAWVARKVYSDADIEGCCYDYEQLPDINGYDRIIIVDFSFPASVLEVWADNAEVIIIDHHKTAMNDLSVLSNRILQQFDMDECGATLAWKYFFPDLALPFFLRYVRDRDLWNFNLAYSEEIHEAIATLKYQSMPEFVNKRTHIFDIFNMLERMSGMEIINVFAPWGYQLLKPKRERIAQLATDAEVQELQGYQILVVEVPETESRLISDLCSYLYRNNSQFDFVVAYVVRGGKVDLSFRSDKKGNNFDVSVIAKSLGGGGHHNAAGATVNKLPWVQL